MFSITKLILTVDYNFPRVLRFVHSYDFFSQRYLFTKIFNPKLTHCVYFRLHKIFYFELSTSWWNEDFWFIR